MSDEWRYYMKKIPYKQKWYIIIKNKVKKHWLISIILIAIIYMLVIHILYKIPSSCDFFITNWTAGDLLSYGGAIVGAIATIYVLQETIHSTLQIQKEETIFSLRPYFLISAEKYDENRIYNSAVMDISSPRTSENYWNGDINILIRVQNVGAGNAIEGTATLSQRDADNMKYSHSPIPALVIGSEQLFLIRYCKPSNLLFELNYSDIANFAHYRASVNIKIACGSGDRIAVYCETPSIERINNK